MMPSCRDISRLVSEAMDHRLPLHQRAMIRLHLSMCALCRRYERQLHLLRQAGVRYADPRENQVIPPLSAAARERLKTSLKQSRS
ncbi:MAG: zf-HC2 domain-containing protein [Verrucomicrobia bacterium]|nr:zf-HC2 domain-containing protein [Verrucomicrobiota bacterium]